MVEVGSSSRLVKEERVLLDFNELDVFSWAYYTSTLTYIEDTLIAEKYITRRPVHLKIGSYPITYTSSKGMTRLKYLIEKKKPGEIRFPVNTPKWVIDEIIHRIQDIFLYSIEDWNEVHAFSITSGERRERKENARRCWGREVTRQETRENN
jgi:hypothetical protein